MPKRDIDFQDPAVVTEVFRTLVANTPVAYTILDNSLRVHFINDYCVALRKIGRDDVVGNLCFNVYNNGIMCSQCAVREAIKTGNRQFLTRKDILPDGSVIYVDDYAIPLASSDGRRSHILEVMVNRNNERRLREENDRLFLALVEALIAMLDKKDPYTSSHSRDVTEIALKLARYAGMPETELHDIRLASLLHDTGKIFVPDTLINKPGSLTNEEYLHIQRHARETADLLSDLSALAIIRDMAASHHERWDGRGYPYGLRGADIPLGGRIIAIADTYDAMTTTRPYRDSLSHQEALSEIEAMAGSQFDPHLAGLFVEMATRRFPEREKLIEQGVAPSARRTTSLSAKVERKLTYLKHVPTQILDASKIRDILSDDQIVRAVMENSPCYYTIIDEEFRTLFASDNLKRNLGITDANLADIHCYELDRRAGKREECFSVDEDGRTHCPAHRAFQTDTVQEGRVVNYFGGRETLCDVYAVPLVLRDREGERFRCVVEILLDRTDELKMWQAAEADIKKLLGRLFTLASSMKESGTSRSREILREAANFGDFLADMRAKMRTLADSKDLFKDATNV